MSEDNKSKKLAFSLGGGGKKKKNDSTKGSSNLFGDDDEDHDDDGNNKESITSFTTTSNEPLVIPVQENTLLTAKTMTSKVRDANIKREEEEVEQPTPTPDVPSSIKSEPDPAHSSTVDATSQEDQDAIAALQAEAGGEGSSNTTSTEISSKMVIAKSENTFQGNKNEEASSNKKSKEDEQFQNELEQLAPELSVTSQTYKQVPISEFGAAMLRGMGWQGSQSTKEEDPAMPRPSRLGLGATPKLLDSMPAAHNRRPKTQTQAEKEKRLKAQQLEYEQKRLKSIQLDKQQTIQVGSIVKTIEDSDNGGRNGRRAIIRQWQGVPGLNMILIQYEFATESTKIKRGNVQLIPRSELFENPFQEPRQASSSCGETRTEYIGLKNRKDDDRSDDRKSSSNRKGRKDDHDDNDYDEGRSGRDDDRRYGKDDYNDDDGRHNRQTGRKSRRDDGDRYNGDDRDRKSRKGRRHHEDYEDSEFGGGGRDRDRRSYRHKDDYDDGDRKRRDRNRSEKRHRDNDDDDYHNRKRSSDDGEDRKSSKRQKKRKDDEYDYNKKNEPPKQRTWLIPNIRVRIISSKYGKSNYKEKGVVIDVSAKGTATLNMGSSSHVLHVPERHLETALPKVGGSACILTGTHRYAKGRLLEVDRGANKASIQVFEDMNIVTTTLDDMAEWCGPLDEDLMD